MKKINFNPKYCRHAIGLEEKKMKECILCGKELEEDKSDFCDSCFTVLTAKYPKTKFKEVKKCHKRNAKRLRKQ